VALHNLTARLRAFSGGIVAGALLCAFVAMAGCRSAPTQPGPKPQPASAAKKPPPGYFVYMVRRGDTLFALGERFHVSWAELADANNIKNPAELPAGTALLVPRAEGAKTPGAPAGKAPQTGPARTAVAPEDLHHGNPSAQYWWPTQGRVVRRFGSRVRGLAEPGIGIAAPVGLEVCAVAAGTVITCVRADPSVGSAWGNVVAISHPGGMASWYAQLDRILVEKGAQVSKGQPIGTVGTGADGRAGIEFRLFRDDRPVNPADYLP
jgi:murein DD-endopeptidase MepM/ murein hydrolase activator NlpD